MSFRGSTEIKVTERSPVGIGPFAYILFCLIRILCPFSFMAQTCFLVASVNLNLFKNLAGFFEEYFFSFDLPQLIAGRLLLTKARV